MFSLSVHFRVKPELLWPVEIRARSPLPAGRVDLMKMASGYIDSGFATGMEIGVSSSLPSGSQ
jgi:hypothetical protein